MSNCLSPRSPYLSPSERDSFSIKLTASCHCGRVKYHLNEDEPLDSKFCHCRGCQVIHGEIQARPSEAYRHKETKRNVLTNSLMTPEAPFQHAAIFEKRSVAFEKESVPFLSYYSSSTGEDTHTLPCKLRCSYCGSPIMDEGRNMILLFPTLSQFESEEARQKFQVRSVDRCVFLGLSHIFLESTLIRRQRIKSTS